MWAEFPHVIWSASGMLTSSHAMGRIEKIESISNNSKAICGTP